MTTIATSVSVVDGPLPDAAALDARVAELRRRFPRAIIDRYLASLPTIGERALIFPGAAVVGDVTVGEDVSIWYGSVLRGDLRPVTVGARTNIQDGTVVHVMNQTHPTTIGDNVTVGHAAVLHGCTIEDRCLIGMGAIVLNGVRIGEGSIVAAGSLVVENMQVPPRSLVMGNPARIRRQLNDAEVAEIQMYADRYVSYRLDYQ